MELLNTQVDTQDLLGEAFDLAENHEGGTPVDPERAAGVALLLARLNDEVLEALEGLKEVLRDHARQKLPDGETVGTVEIPGRFKEDDLGVVVVAFSPTQVKLDKKADLKRLKKTLGPAFSDYFEETITYAPHREFRERTEAALAGTQAAEARLALRAVKLSEATPRVSFKPTGT